MVQIPQVPPAVTSTLNVIANAAKRVPVLPTIVGFFYKNVLATPVQGLASLVGKATRPALSDMKASALTIAALFALNYARKTTYGEKATKFVSTNVGHYSGLTAKADKAIAKATADVTAKKEAIAKIEAESKDVLEAASTAEKALADARKLEANTAEDDLKGFVDAAKASAEKAKGPAEALKNLQGELETAVKALTAAKTFWATTAAKAKADAALKPETVEKK